MAVLIIFHFPRLSYFLKSLKTAEIGKCRGPKSQKMMSFYKILRHFSSKIYVSLKNEIMDYKNCIMTDTIRKSLKHMSNNPD